MLKRWTRFARLRGLPFPTSQQRSRRSGRCTLRWGGGGTDAGIFAHRRHGRPAFAVEGAEACGWPSRLAGGGLARRRRPALARRLCARRGPALRSEEHTSELQYLMRQSYAVFCLQKKKRHKTQKKKKRKSTYKQNIQTKKNTNSNNKKKRNS